MKVKIRTHPIDVYYLTGDDARRAREEAGTGSLDAPCFVTSSFGGDGFCWHTCEGFEADYRDTFGGLGTPEKT